MTIPLLYKGNNNGDSSLTYYTFPLPNSSMGVMKLESELINYKFL